MNGKTILRAGEDSSLNEFKFTEINSISATTSSGDTSEVRCCDMSPDGKLLATGHEDGNVILWCTNTLEQKMLLQDHSAHIIDMQFSPYTARLATSSYDKTVRVWEVNTTNPNRSLIRTFTGHNRVKRPVDFLPHKDDHICYGDGVGRVRH